MRRIISLAMAGATLAFAISPASSQQLQQQTPLATPPAQPIGTGPRLDQAQATKPAEIPSSLDQRPQSSSPIQSVGPAKQPPGQPATSSSELARPVEPTKLLDATGRRADGMIRVAPNRVYDPVTKRYYWTTPPAQPR
jgi:hypothetical protein